MGEVAVGIVSCGSLETETALSSTSVLGTVEVQ